MDDIIRPIGPAVSEFIPFAGVSFTRVMYGDMRYFSIKYLCDYLGMTSYQAKIKTLRRKWLTRDHVVKVLYSGSTGKHVTWCIDEHGLTAWLMYMKTNKLPLDMQAMVDQIQSKMIEAIGPQFPLSEIIKRLGGGEIIDHEVDN